MIALNQSLIFSEMFHILFQNLVGCVQQKQNMIF